MFDNKYLKKEKVKDLHYTLSLVFPKDLIEKKSDELLMEHGKKTKLAGFRPGHIPLEVLRQHFGNAMLDQAINSIMNEWMDGYIAEKKIRLAGSPKADMKNYQAGNDLDFNLDFDILPALPKIELDKITLTKKVAEFDEKEAEKALDNIAKSRRVLKEIADENTVAKKGHTAVIDFKGFVGDTAFEGGEAKKHYLELGSNTFIPGFEDQIIGHKKGDKFDVNVKFPKEYHAENLAGKDARFEILLHELKEVSIPEINDDFAKEVGMENVAKLKDHIKKILMDQYDIASKNSMKEELLDVLADKVKMDIPESLIEQEFDLAKRNAESKKETFDEKSAKKDAEKRVKLGLILAEWGNQNKVELTQEEVQQAIMQEAMRYPGQQQAVFDYYNKNRNALMMLRGMLYEGKVLDTMLGHVKTKDKQVKAKELFEPVEAK